MILNWFSFGSRAHFSHCQHCSMRQVAFLTFHNWFFRSLGSAWWKKRECLRERVPMSKWSMAVQKVRTRPWHNSAQLGTTMTCWTTVTKACIYCHSQQFSGLDLKASWDEPFEPLWHKLPQIATISYSKYCKIHWMCQQKRRTFDLFWSILSFCNSPAHSQYLADHRHVLRKMVRRRFMHPQM